MYVCSGSGPPILVVCIYVCPGPPILVVYMKVCSGPGPPIYILVVCVFWFWFSCIHTMQERSKVTKNGQQMADLLSNPEWPNYSHSYEQRIEYRTDVLLVNHTHRFHPLATPTSY